MSLKRTALTFAIAAAALFGSSVAALAAPAYATQTSMSAPDRTPATEPRRPPPRESSTSTIAAAAGALSRNPATTGGVWPTPVA